jgi:hypothetical protein
VLREVHVTEQQLYRWCARGSRNDEHCAQCGRMSSWIDNCTDLCERCYGAPRPGRPLEAGPRMQAVLDSLGLALPDDDA